MKLEKNLQELNVHCISILCLRLHDYYKFDVERFVNEGVFETDQIEAYSNGDLTVWDAFKIGVKGANKMFLGSGLQVQKLRLFLGNINRQSHPFFTFY